MAQLIFGKSRSRKIIFVNDNQFYEALGFLCKNNNTTRLVLERNDLQGAWEREGRIQFYVNRLYPTYFSNAFSAGNGRILHRINNTQYCEYIKNNYSVVDGFIQNIPNVTANIPSQFIADFNRGITL